MLISNYSIHYNALIERIARPISNFGEIYI